MNNMNDQTPHPAGPAEVAAGDPSQPEPQPEHPVDHPAPARPASGIPEGAVRVRVRRAPKYRPFTVTGAVLGLVAGIAVSVIFGRASDRFAPSVLIGYLAVIGMLIGGVLGAGAAVLAERAAAGQQRG